MQLRLADWPPILSHTVAFILGVMLIYLTLEDHVVPVNIPTGKIIFSLSDAELSDDWQKAPPVLPSLAKLVLLKSQQSKCTKDSLTVRILSAAPHMVLISSSKNLVKIDRLLNSAHASNVLRLQSISDASLASCAKGEIVIND